jgi:hypothetical protein
MTTSTVASQRRTYLDRPSPSGLADVLELILDKGLVIDIYLRIAVIGIELITLDARIVVASVDTYLRFAEAVNRLDLTQTEEEGLPELLQDLRQGGAEQKTHGALEGVKDEIKETVHRRRRGDDDDSGGDSGSRSRPRARRSEQE